MGFLQYLIEDFSNNPKPFLFLFGTILFYIILGVILNPIYKRNKEKHQSMINDINSIPDLKAKIAELESKVDNN